MKAIFIISGEKKSGKTLLLQRIISGLTGKGYQLKGFYSLHDEINDRYYIREIQTGNQVLLMTRTGGPDEKPGHFIINESAVKAGVDWMRIEKEDRDEILVMDEIGYFELNGMVWDKLFSSVVESPHPLIFTTKSKLLPRVIRKWGLHPAAVFYPPDFLSPGKIVEQITRVLSREGSSFI